MGSEAATATITTDSNEAVQTKLTALLAENPAGFDCILATFRRDLRPANFTEDILVQRTARHFWGALRTTRLETALVESQMHSAATHPEIQKFAETHGKGYDYDTRRLGVAFQTDCGQLNAQLKS